MKTPRANGSAAARHLREAALAFASYSLPETGDPYDREGQRLNRQLLAAAREYSKAYDADDGSRERRAQERAYMRARISRRTA